MTREQLALMYAGNIKAGLCTRAMAVVYYRSRHELSFVDALTDINIAIGDWNEGKRYNDAPAYAY